MSPKDFYANFTSGQLPDQRPLTEEMKITSWEPLKYSGTSYKTHIGTEISNTQFDFTISVMTKLQPVFILLTPVIFSLFVRKGASFGNDFDTYFGFTAIELIVAVLSVIIALIIFFSNQRIIRFDKSMNFYYRGWKYKMNTTNRRNNPRFTRLDSIKAIQVIPERVKPSKSSPYISYELNLVLKDGERLNILDHNKKEQLFKDADALSVFLGVPLWNRIID